MPTDRDSGPIAARYLLDPIVLSIVFIVAVSAVFLAAPWIDIVVTDFFYEPGIGFPAGRNPHARMLRDLNTVFIIAVLTALLANILIKLARPERPSPINPSASFFIFMTLIAGPVIVVNGIFKTFSGRPRPSNVDLFGGDFPFVPVWQFAEHCPRNCSFVSGEGSSAFWALAVWLVLPPRIRRMVAVPVFVYVAAISLNRVAFGGHFISDVLLSWAFMALIIAVAWRWIIQSPPEWLSNAKAEERGTRAGLALRRLVRGG